MRVALWVLGGVLALVGLYTATFGLSFLNIHARGVLRAEQVDVDRNVFENSVSYTRGARSNFDRIRTQLEAESDDDARRALCSALLRTSANDTDALTTDQRAFLQSLRSRGC